MLSVESPRPLTVRRHRSGVEPRDLSVLLPWALTGSALPDPRGLSGSGHRPHVANASLHEVPTLDQGQLGIVRCLVEARSLDEAARLNGVSSRHFRRRACALRRAVGVETNLQLIALVVSAGLIEPPMRSQP